MILGHELWQRTFGGDPNSVWGASTGPARGRSESAFVFGPPEDTRPSVYLPHQKMPLTGMALVARTSSNPTDFSGAIRREVAQLDPDLPVSQIATMEEVVAESIWQPRLYTTLFAVFAGGALALALIGIYGVMAFLVQTRTHEIGVRMALGATARDVFKLLVGRGMKLTAVGIVIGAVGYE